MTEHPVAVVMLEPGQKAPQVYSGRIGNDELADIEFVWPCAYLGPATEDGPDDGCGAEAPEDGAFCDYHAVRSGQVEGCAFCCEVGASDEHQKECERLFMCAFGHPDGSEGECQKCAGNGPDERRGA